jgi:hypothetical protein
MVDYPLSASGPAAALVAPSHFGFWSGGLSIAWCHNRKNYSCGQAAAISKKGAEGAIPLSRWHVSPP